MDTNARDLLHHLKTDYLKKNNPDKFKEKEEKCAEQINDLIHKDVEYFSKCVGGYNLTQIHCSISLYSLQKMKPAEVYELKKNFNLTTPMRVLEDAKK